MSQDVILNPPLLTADLPGIGGRIKFTPDDFEVEEIPLYEPSGEGEHLYLWVEKRDVGPEFFARRIAEKLGTHAGNVGTAGLKDRRAVTRQWVSVPAQLESRIPAIDGEGIRVLRVSRHSNKLKPGHLLGNRFRVLIRQPENARRKDLPAILDRLRTQGLPNFYGAQRFGRNGSTLATGWDCLHGRLKRRLRPFVFKFALSAVQSALFNDYLARRLVDGLLHTVLPGDVMAKRSLGGLFRVEDLAREQARFDARETMITGPMFGKKTFPAAGPAAEREAAVLRDHGLTPATFARFGKLVMGTRRPNLVLIDELTADWEPGGVRLGFTLPAGSYATVLLREIMKTPGAEDSQDTDEPAEPSEG